MIRAFSIPAARAAEAATGDALASGALMRAAADALADVVLARAREREGTSVVVLVGPGDNGGDALYAAAHLAEHLTVVAVQVGDRVHEEGLSASTAAGVPRLQVDRAQQALTHPVRQALEKADVVVDGLLGIGARPGLTGAMAGLAESIPEAALVIAVDLPSGADPEGVTPLGVAVHAHETVTFGMAKPVHVLPATRPAVGRLTVVDIGVPEPEDAAVEQLTGADVPALWPVPGAFDHKYSRGVVGIVAGSDAYPGAAVLTTTAAVESGAGMVRYLGPDRPTGLVLAACPEAVPGEGRVQAAVVGPGIDPQGCDHPDCDGHQVERVRETFGEQVPLVVDAGAVQLLAWWLEAGNRRPAPTLLTPHAGELATLLTTLEHREVTREQVEAAPLAHARRAAAVTDCTVLLKGATTLVVSPDPGRPVRAQGDAPPWLATAGAGDVLAGLLGTLVASGMDPLDAGALGALVHGRAAHHANPGGPVRALAVARALPRTVAGLLGSEA